MEKYNLFLDDIRNPELCLNYKTEYMPENRSVYSLEQWVVVRNYPEFVEVIKKNFGEGKFPGLISFDHDLADAHYATPFEDFSLFTSEQLGVEETGSDCARFIVQFCLDQDLDLPKYYVHSANPDGRRRIHMDMQDYYRYKGRF